MHGGRLFLVLEASGRPKNIAGGKMAGAQTFREEFRLGAFADPGRTEQNNPPGFAERLARGHFATGFATFEPRGAVMFWHPARAFIFWKKSVGIHAATITQPSNLPSAGGRFPKICRMFDKKSWSPAAGVVARFVMVLTIGVWQPVASIIRLTLNCGSNFNQNHQGQAAGEERAAAHLSSAVARNRF
jgi:hypothetical protein